MMPWLLPADGLDSLGAKCRYVRGLYPGKRHEMRDLIVECKGVVRSWSNDAHAHQMCGQQA
jgi:hypothetical protein